MIATATSEYLTLSGDTVHVVLASATYEGEKILDCQEINVRHQKDELKKLLAEGWKLVTIAWVRDEHTNYGHEPAVNHVLRAVVVQTQKEGN